ncbi:TetR/AcrR family transcriptional regulator [Nocardia seriolae]|uniref:TetR/AcrR family transcriptional regulator n=1 Tax=Nocardia seriolae TaxID=37332 RepID=UPI00051A0ED9|nr:TetR/AcrR family transcriptional regulator [Nocardia seriolae]MTJ62615.1 TetR family transcriptional regulator [Nocardia seriolae]MTJ76548.1 TetR family transcriptional regulator [Nocardia seriolae]MTJ89344.1 TetR family transcriptional regulator [Nocardia seriolae]MTK33321.1 TetR family transcriptional regulator [Nocardia seriolae]MTK42434.1 TetR family transcriptional regulator [Nocardia seriolae]
MPVAELPPNKHQERSQRTRGLLLDATIESLAEVGYANASTGDISGRAGVTRGAFLHHFHTRTELFAQAIEHLATRQRAAAQQVAEAVSATTRPADILVDLIAATFAGELGSASVELFVAIRHDQEQAERMLRVPRDLAREVLEQAIALIGPEIPADNVEHAFWMTINFVRGTIVDDMLGRNPQRRKQMLEHWRTLAAVALTEAAGRD